MSFGMKKKKRNVETPVEKSEPVFIADVTMSTQQLALDRIELIKEKGKPFVGVHGYNPFILLFKAQNLYNAGEYEKVLAIPTPTEDDFKV